jgi:hypothetical protein
MHHIEVLTGSFSQSLEVAGLELVELLDLT